MARISLPLSYMGAKIGLKDGRAPVRIHPDHPLHGITYSLPVASAQLKSAILLAGLYAEGTTTVIETTASRDHTERMLGLPVRHVDGARHISVHNDHPLPPLSMALPRDFSAAAFFLVAGSITETRRTAASRRRPEPYSQRAPEHPQKNGCGHTGNFACAFQQRARCGSGSPPFKAYWYYRGR